MWEVPVWPLSLEGCASCLWSMVSARRGWLGGWVARRGVAAALALRLGWAVP